MTARIGAVLAAGAAAATPRRVAGLLATGGATAVAYGIGMIYTPAGVIAAGLLATGAAYLVAYFGTGRAQ